MAAIEFDLNVIDDFYAGVELFLRSFYDVSLTTVRQGLVLENNCSRIVFAKEPIDNGNAVFKMTLFVTSPMACEHVYHLAFDGKPFAIREPIKPQEFTVVNIDEFIQRPTR